MKVVPYKNNSQRTNFTSNNLIMVAKKAFDCPENLSASTQTFADAISTIGAEIGYKGKVRCFLEQPLYVEIMENLNSEGFSLGWLRNTTKIPIADPFSEDYHAFCAYTEKHGQKISKIFKSEGIRSLLIDTSLKYMAMGGRNLRWTLAKENQLCLQEIQRITKGEKIHIFKINNLSDELRAALAKIEEIDNNSAVC